MKTIEINNLNDLNKAARSFLNMAEGNRKFAFYGPMGSGKTTFIKAICEELGAKSLVTSPTFSLVNEYTLSNGEPLYHFDLYRINKTGELFDLGYEEYFYGDNYLFIEWPEKAEELLPDPIVHVFIEEVDANKRIVTIHV